MKTLVKIVISLIVVTGCFNASRAALNNYQFEDKVKEGLLYDPRATDPTIVEMVTKLAAEFTIPLDPSNVSIRHVGQEVFVDMTYTQNVVVIPGVFQREWTFNPSASGRFLPGAGR